MYVGLCVLVVAGGIISGIVLSAFKRTPMLTAACSMQRRWDSVWVVVSEKSAMSSKYTVERKDDMIPFPYNENQFSLFFFVADHLLVGQLCTNSKSDRSLLSCLKVTQCSTSEIEDTPLYNTCSLPIQLMTIGPLPLPSKCKSGWPRIIGTRTG